MDLLAAFLIFAGGIVSCLFLERSLVWGLLLGLVCFLTVGRRRGYSWKELFGMSRKGAMTAFPVIRVLVMIGSLTALWRASGTITFFVYHGIGLIRPYLFLMIVFLLTASLSFCIGTSFGVAGTAGVVLMILARSGGVDEAVTAGVIMSGAYFGERCSPASSSTLLAVSLSKADGRKNLNMMLKTSILPMVLTIAIYGVLSWKHPLFTMDGQILEKMAAEFVLSWVNLVPAAVLLVLALSGIPIFYAVAISNLCAFGVAVVVQKASVLQVIGWTIFGFQPASGELAPIFAGGGILSMLGVIALVVLSSIYSGIFRGTGMLEGVQRQMARLADRVGAFAAQMILAVFSGGIFCNQTIGTILAEQMLGNLYEDKQEKAADVCNSIIVMAAWIPWSAACSGPLTMLGVGSEALRYSVLLYLVPVTYLLTKRLWYPDRNLSGRSQR